MILIGDLLQCNMLPEKVHNLKSIKEHLLLTNIKYLVPQMIINILLDFMAATMSHLIQLD